jgi:hypothetical protein
MSSTSSASNNKTYWKIMKMLLKSNKGSGNFPPLQNIINDQHLEEFDYDDFFVWTYF